MSIKIICPYCFKQMNDDQVLFRSEKVNQGECDIIPDNYDDIDDFIANYIGSDKEDIIAQYEEWDLFAQTEDEIYEEFWKNYGGTTEYNPADELLYVKAYHRKVIDTRNVQHQKYIMKQPDGSFFIRDNTEDGMVSQIELNTGEKCNRRVCCYCHNPLPDKYGKNPVKFTSVIGITGAGKTIYLSQLLKRMSSYTVKVGLSAVVNNPGARIFLEHNVIMANEPLPSSTPAARFQQPLFYEMVRDGINEERITETFVLYDVAGEVFKAPELIKRFAPFIEHADGVIVLIDPMQFSVICGASAYGRALDDPNTVLDIIHNIVSHGNTKIKCDTPFAVCITKVDTIEVQRVLSDELKRLLLDDVHGVKDESGFYLPVFNARGYNPIAKELCSFIQSNEIVLAQQMNTNYSCYSFFAFTALGSDVLEGETETGERYQYPVGPILPKRIEEPLLWLFHKFGYIQTNEPLFNPGHKKVKCVFCGSNDTYELKDSDMWIEKGFGPFKRKKEVHYSCNECGEKW